MVHSLTLATTPSAGAGTPPAACGAGTGAPTALVLEKLLLAALPPQVPRRGSIAAVTPTSGSALSPSAKAVSAIGSQILGSSAKERHLSVESVISEAECATEAVPRIVSDKVKFFPLPTLTFGGVLQNGQIALAGPCYGKKVRVEDFNVRKDISVGTPSLEILFTEEKEYFQLFQMGEEYCIASTDGILTFYDKPFNTVFEMKLEGLFYVEPFDKEILCGLRDGTCLVLRKTDSVWTVAANVIGTKSASESITATALQMGKVIRGSSSGAVDSIDLASGSPIRMLVTHPHADSVEHIVSCQESIVTIDKKGKINVWKLDVSGYVQVGRHSLEKVQTACFREGRLYIAYDNQVMSIAEKDLIKGKWDHSLIATLPSSVIRSVSSPKLTEVRTPLTLASLKNFLDDKSSFRVSMDPDTGVKMIEGVPLSAVRFETATFLKKDTDATACARQLFTKEPPFTISREIPRALYCPLTSPVTVKSLEQQDKDRLVEKSYTLSSEPSDEEGLLTFFVDFKLHFESYPKTDGSGKRTIQLLPLIPMPPPVTPSPFERVLALSVIHFKDPVTGEDKAQVIVIGNNGVCLIDFGT